MLKINRSSLFIPALILMINCSPKKKEKEDTGQSDPRATIGSIEKLSEELDEIIPENAEIEILADGFIWAEGPVWVPQLKSVLFTDVPMNTIYQWNESDGLSTFLKPSGSTGYAPSSGDEGANGLILDADGNLILCQHGDRRVARFIGDFNDPEPKFETIVDTYQSSLFNSPNDLILSRSGDLYFTDPPYGLEDHDSDELKELSFNGLYKYSASGELTLLDSTLTRPNGLALSPDEKTLYVANSDPKRAIWMAYDVTENGIENGRVFYEATDLVSERPGLPDGMKVNQDGIIFATGPGGVLIFKPDGTHLGTILTELASANCALGPDEKTLYMTTHKYLTRISLK